MTTRQRMRRPERDDLVQPPNAALPEQAALKQEGRLAPIEVESLLRVYRAGTRGETLIGLRQSMRLLTMHLPSQVSEQEAVMQMQRVTTRLRDLRCDGWVHARRIRVGHPATPPTKVALMVDECLSQPNTDCIREQNIIPLDGAPEQTRLRGSACLDDAVSLLLRQNLIKLRT